MSEELKPCPFCKKKPLIRNAYGSVQPRLNHSCGFVDIHEGCPSDWNNAYCWQQLSRSEELNRELVKASREIIACIDETIEFDDSKKQSCAGNSCAEHADRLRQAVARIKEMGK